MTGCERIHDDLKAYLDGELRWAENWSVRRHLAGCSGCRKELAEMESLQTRLRASDTGEFPAALRARILAAVPEPAAERRYRERPSGAGRFSLAWAAITSVLLIGFVSWPAVRESLDSVQSPAQESLVGNAKSSAASGGAQANEMTENPGRREIRPPAGLLETARGGSETRSLSKEVSPAKNRVRAPGPDAARTSLPQTEADSIRHGPGSAQAFAGAESRAGRPTAGDAGGLAAGSQPRDENFSKSTGAAVQPDTYRFAADSLHDRSLTTLGAQVNAFTIVVDNVNAKAERITSTVSANGGKTFFAEWLGYRAASEQVLTLDVPVERLEQTITLLKQQGEVMEALTDARARESQFGESRGRSRQADGHPGEVEIDKKQDASGSGKQVNGASSQEPNLPGMRLYGAQSSLQRERDKGTKNDSEVRVEGPARRRDAGQRYASDAAVPAGGLGGGQAAGGGFGGGGGRGGSLNSTEVRQQAANTRGQNSQPGRSERESKDSYGLAQSARGAASLAERSYDRTRKLEQNNAQSQPGVKLKAGVARESDPGNRESRNVRRESQATRRPGPAPGFARLTVRLLQRKAVPAAVAPAARKP